MSLAAVQMASAADMAVKSPVLKAAPAVATNWTGVYVSGGFGYGIWSADTTTINSATGACILCVNQMQGGKGWLGVIGVGYDHQFTSNIVAGVFADYNLSQLKGTIQDQGPFFAGEIKQTSAWAAGGRLGWLFTPDFLAYVNAGYTSARFSSADMLSAFTGASTGFSTSAFTTNGWFVGGGTETTLSLLGSGWFWRSEYRYASYDSKTLADTGPGVQANITFKPTVQTITSQLVYKLNTGGPTFAAPAPIGPVNWNGVYVNAGLGYGGWVADTTTLNADGSCRLCTVQVQGGKGWLGVVGIGYDHLVTPNILLGVFADFNGSQLKGTIQDQDPFFAGEIKQTSAWAVGARAGWVFMPRALGYGNIGFTSARFSGADMVNTGTGAATGFSTPAFTTNGWFLGSGAEVAVTPNLFWRNEYRFARYSDKTLTDSNGAVNARFITFKPSVQTVTTQLVYKFNWWR